MLDHDCLVQGELDYKPFQLNYDIDLTVLNSVQTWKFSLYYRREVGFSIAQILSH